MNTNILVLLADGFEEIEVVTPLDLWRRAGFQVTIASISDSLTVTGQYSLSLIANTLLDDVVLENFDNIFIPGGNGHANIKNSPKSMHAIDYFATHSKNIFAICAAPTIMGEWIQDKSATCYPTMKHLVKNWKDEKVVVDLPFITGQGPGVAHIFALEVMKFLKGIEFTTNIQKESLFN